MPVAAPVPIPSEWCISAHHRNRLLLPQAHKMTVSNASPALSATHIPHLVSPVSKVVPMAVMANRRHWECWLRWKLYQINQKFSVAEKAVSTNRRNGDRQSKVKVNQELFFPCKMGLLEPEGAGSFLLPLLSALLSSFLFELVLGWAS